MNLDNSRESTAHFDIKLVDSMSCGASSSLADPLVSHQVRQDILHPLPSAGYLPIFGSIPEIAFRKGVAVTSVNKLMAQPKTYSFESSVSPLLFAYCLEGSRFFRIKGSGVDNSMHSGSWYIGYIPECSGVGVITGAPRFRGVTLRFDPLVLFDLLDGRVEDLPRKLFGLLTSLESGVITLGGKMSTALTRAVTQLLICNERAPFNRLFFESSMIDVLMLHLDELGGGGHCATDSLSGQEKRVARVAREFVLENVLDPPSLNDLAALSGVSPVVMKTVFFKAFGESVHSFIQSRRLESAKQLLASGEYQVSEVAQKVGYTNTSWFIDVFSRHFGLKPGEYLREVKRLYCLSTPWADSEEQAGP